MRRALGRSEVKTPGERPDPATGIGNLRRRVCVRRAGGRGRGRSGTGRVTIIKIVAAQDVGRALNPVALEGQVYGGVLQGIGMALQEELVFEEGRPVNASFLDYKVPRISDAPPIEIALIETLDAEGPFGAKAAAEPTINATIAAIANAIAHATGHRFHELPMNPARVLGMLAARAAKPLALKPWKRPFNAEVAAVRSLCPGVVFPALRKVGTRFARLPDKAAKPDLAVPTSLAELVQELARPGRRARILAGGTDMLVGLRQGIYDPDLLVDVTGIAELRGIREADGWLHIGAATTLAEVLESELAQRALPALAEGVRMIATPQIRRVATVAGDLCQEKRCWFFRSAFPCYKLGGSTCPCFAVQGDSRHHSILGARRCAAPCPADLAPILAALDARLVVAGPGGLRVLAMADLYLWSGLTSLRHGEAIVRVEIPLPRESTQAFEKFAQRQGDFAEASVAVRLEWQGGRLVAARIALGAVSPFPARATASERALCGTRPDARRIRSAAEMTVHGSLPLADNAHTAHLLVALAERAIARACA
ncbi:MAG: FAD binding domain-containing protein [Betaproteobacteria bacterium]|nr:FAD binding domain-containing protein [Betaproteobacteria bacterium]